MAQQQLVPTPHGTCSDSNSPNQPTIVPGSPREHCLRLLLSDPAPTRLAFLKETFGRSVSADNIDLLLAGKRISTNKQYQSVWTQWLRFVIISKPSEITLDFCLSFFRSLFESGKRPKTLSSYKSALRDPLWWAFGIDLNGDLFNMMIKGCGLRRPDSPPRPISWSLHKVLAHLNSIDARTARPRQLLGKTLFLLALATGSRVSELVALSRDKGHITFYPSGVAKLIPDRTFLAKNELPTKRKKPLRVLSLDNDHVALCPVSTLKIYLERTVQYSCGHLFRTHSTGTPLSAFGLRREIVGIIKVSNPDSYPKTHDIRKLASSFAFFEDMAFTDLVEYTGWSSTRVFMKHYLKEVESLPLVCVTAGRVTVPADSPSDEDTYT